MYSKGPVPAWASLLLFYCGFACLQARSETESDDSFTSKKKTLPSNAIHRAEGGYGFHSGTSGSSFSGQKFTSLTLGRETKSGVLRMFGQVGFDLMPSALVTLGASGTESRLKYFGLKVGLGANLYPIASSTLQPFVGAAGTYTRGGADPSPPTPDLEDFFRPNLYGYEVSVGFDFKISRSYTARLRVRGTYSVEMGTFSGITGFKAESVKLSAGLAF